MSSILNFKLRKNKLFYLLLIGLALWFLPKGGEAATLSISPSSGSYVVGNTFDVSIYMDTQGESINAMNVILGFSPDKLQLVSPSAGKSVIEIWTAAPQFNNQAGTIKIQGGIPGGINVHNGLVATLTFRVKSVGSTHLKFLDGSKLLLNDGLGTDALRNTTNASYTLTLPPPAGPIVSSTTHPNQSVWYPNNNVNLLWEPAEGADGYSYVLNREPVDPIDNISEGLKTSVSYNNLSDGTYYFHIKGLRNGTFGGVTHFAIQIDSTPPANFPVTIIPSARTTRRQPVVQFETSDANSGIDHYELKLIPLTKIKNDSNTEPLFIEVISPYILPPMDFGKYDLVLRAYDKAGNYREVTKRLAIVTATFQFIGEDGFEFRNVVIITWPWFWAIVTGCIILLWYWAKRSRIWHHSVHIRIEQKHLPPDVQKQLDELKRYKSKYGPKSLILLLLIGLSLLCLPHASLAEQQVQIAPPIIDTVSRNISNQEIFYVGGKTQISETEVVLYIQSLQDGQTISEKVTSDKNGNWFYRHDTFLSSGNYLLWAQSQFGEQLSPPSPQIQLVVQSTAIQFGASRLSYETLYLLLLMVAASVVVLLLFYIAFHLYHGRQKHLRFIKEMREAQESVRRGFAVLRRDIQGEFSLIKQARLDGSLSAEQRRREEQLTKDLRDVEQYIGKEIWDIEENEYSQ